MFMQLGFAMLETGFTRAKNAVNTMAMNFMIYPIGVIGFWLTGYGFMMGGVSHWPSLGAAPIGHHEVTLAIGGHPFGLIGLSKFALVNVAHDPASLAMFLFAVVFMDTAATIPTGAMAERWKFSAFFVYGLFMSMFLYPLYGNWVWGGGWLSQLGDELRAWPRPRRFRRLVGGAHDRRSDRAGRRDRARPAHRQVSPRRARSAPCRATTCRWRSLGTLILAFGWFGFNAGSTLAASDARIGPIAANTMLASAAGTLAALLYIWQRFGKPDIAMACNGMLGGLVAITAPCAFVIAGRGSLHRRGRRADSGRGP